jgi:3-hydroxy-3-methylglutaryl CoA synthase
VGPGAPLVLEPHPWLATHSAHTWDFYKPHGHPCFPVVDGPASLHWFSAAAEGCAATLWQQVTAAQRQQRQQQEEEGAGASTGSQQAGGGAAAAAAAAGSSRGAGGQGLLASVDAFVCHAPFNKIVQKTFARLALQDALR